MLLWVLTVLAAEPGRWGDLDRAVRVAEEAADRAALHVRALGAVQNAWVEGPGRTGARCQADNAGLWVSSRALGQATRDELQLGRSTLLRVEALRVENTVAPLVDELMVARIDAVRGRMEELVVWWEETARLQKSWIHPWGRRCPEPEPFSGVREAYGPVPVIAEGPGWLCPARVPADGRAVIVDEPSCVADSTLCECTPRAFRMAEVVTP